MDIRNINLSFFPSVLMCSWHFLVFSKHCQHKCEYTIKKSPKKWGGTRVLVPRHQNSDALSSWQLVFYCNLENGHQEYQFVFFLKCIYVSLTFFGYIRILPAKIKDSQPRKHQKNCGGTRVLVPGHQNSGALSSWQLFFYCNLENGHQEYQFVFFPSVFMFSWLFLVLSEYCQHMWGYTAKKTPKKLWRHESSGARAPELWCPFKLTTGFLF